MLEFLKIILSEIVRKDSTSTPLIYIIINITFTILCVFLIHYRNNKTNQKILLTIKMISACSISNSILFIIDKIFFVFIIPPISAFISEILIIKYIMKNISNNNDNKDNKGPTSPEIKTPTEKLYLEETLVKELEDEKNVNEKNFSTRLLNDNEKSYFDPNYLNMEIASQANLSSMLDILVLYNYISTNHRNRFYKECLFIDEPEDNIKKFLEMQILTEEELEEAKFIKNLIKQRKRLISKEEAQSLSLQFKKARANKEKEIEDNIC